MTEKAQGSSATSAARSSPASRPTFEQVEEAFTRWESLFWQNYPDSQINEAAEEFDALADAYMRVDREQSNPSMVLRRRS
jgi:hypothetical protein